jgi:thioredoxin 1
MKLTDDNFEQVLPATTRPYLLNFRAAFCGPSNVVAGLLDHLFDEGWLADEDIIDIDVEAFPKLTRAMQIKGTPTLLLMKDGQPLGSRIGTMPYEDLVAFISTAIDK